MNLALQDSLLVKSVMSFIWTSYVHQHLLDPTEQIPWTLSRKFSGGWVGGRFSHVTCVILKPGHFRITAKNVRGGRDDLEFGEGRAVPGREYLPGEELF